MNEEEKRAIEIFQSHRGDHERNEAWVKHYLYVDGGRDARRLGRHLAGYGFKVAVQRSGDGEKWLVLVKHRISVTGNTVETLRDFLESLVVTKKGGEYGFYRRPVYIDPLLGLSFQIPPKGLGDLAFAVHAVYQIRHDLKVGAFRHELAWPDPPLRQRECGL